MKPRRLPPSEGPAFFFLDARDQQEAEVTLLRSARLRAAARREGGRLKVFVVARRPPMPGGVVDTHLYIDGQKSPFGLIEPETAKAHRDVFLLLATAGLVGVADCRVALAGRVRAHIRLGAPRSLWRDLSRLLADHQFHWGHHVSDEYLAAIRERATPLGVLGMADALVEEIRWLRGVLVRARQRLSWRGAPPGLVRAWWSTVAQSDSASDQRYAEAFSRPLPVPSETEMDEVLAVTQRDGGRYHDFWVLTNEVRHLRALLRASAPYAADEAAAAQLLKDVG